jgi:hypothetical protein
MARARHFHQLVALLAAPLLTLALAAPAFAAPPERFVIDEEFSFEGDTCGVATESNYSESGKGTRLLRSGDHPYYRLDYQAALEITRLSTGLTVRLAFHQLTSDTRIIDNGDGTITILLAGVFNEADYAPDGTVGLRTQGRETAVVTIDTNGTPGTEDDDVELSFDFLGFNGHDDRETTDFCDWFLDVTA